ncbi:MAG: hypothetical protein M1837_006864 [Sclerophora amabilis]|nr:MAG: hypothetical protein M1837_006864 [Sclerophora amabilis]
MSLTLKPGRHSTFSVGVDGKRVHEMMQELIDQYFITHLSLSPLDAYDLHQNYYKQYGLAIEGLVRHHAIDPLEYNALVDDALPLEDVIHPDPQLRQLLLDLDRDKVKLWLFTNAYVNHASRVVRLLGVEDLFEGVTYCDYAAPRLVCKPAREMYEKAMKEAAQGRRVEECYFVDDSFLNCNSAQDFGWTSVHLLERDDREPATKAARYQIRSLQELRDLFPQFFRDGVDMDRDRDGDMHIANGHDR